MLKAFRLRNENVLVKENVCKHRNTCLKRCETAECSFLLFYWLIEQELKLLCNTFFC